MGDWMSYDLRSIIQDTLLLLEEESILLSSPEDASYFRSMAKKKGEPLASPPQIFKAPPPPLPPAFEKAEEPPPSPPPLPPAPLEKKGPDLAQWKGEFSVSSEPVQFAPLQAVFQKMFPQIALCSEIPSDVRAKNIAHRWKTKNQVAPISVLHLNEPPKQKALLCEIVKAIDVSFGSTRLIDAEAIEKEKQWETFLLSETLQLVIVCDYTLWQLTDLARHYKEAPAQSIRTLGNIPLLLLPDLSLYLKDPLLKRSLWKAICKRLS